MHSVLMKIDFKKIVICKLNLVYSMSLDLTFLTAELVFLLRHSHVKNKISFCLK